MGQFETKEPGIGYVGPGEWRWILAVTLVLLLLSTLPYVAAYAAQSPEQVFNGALFDRQDYAVHLATMHLGERGEWAYSMRFTSETQQGAYIKMGYIFLGHVARWIGASLPFTFHLARLAFGGLACIGIYLLAAQCFVGIAWRRLATLLAAFGAGLGWLQLSLGWLPQADISPVDFWLIDGYIFFGILTLPHLSAVTALLVAMLVSGLSFLRSPAWWKWLVAALAALTLQAFQPYAPLLADIALVGAILAAWLQRRRVRWGELGFLLALGLCQLPLLVYNAGVLTADPLWRSFIDQNVTLSPPPVYYLWGYGLLWLLAAIGAVAWLLRIVRQAQTWRDSPELPSLAAALAWVVAALMLAYAPFALQRRFMHANILPLSLLAVAGIKEVIHPWLEKRAPHWLAQRSRLWVVLLVVFVSLSSIVLALGNSLYVLSRPAALFDPVELVRAADWLEAHAGQDDVVLSTERSGQLIAARAGLPVYLGHPIETLDYERKTGRVAALYRGEDMGAWLAGSGVRWVLFGPYEQVLGGGTAPGLPLEIKFNDNGVLVYAVLP